MRFSVPLFHRPFVLLWLAFAAVPPAAAAETAAATVPATPAPAAAADEAPAEETVQVLIFADGDRTRGKLLRREGDTLVFQSQRFGELRVPAGGAKVVDESVAVASAAKPKSPPPAAPPRDRPAPGVPAPAAVPATAGAAPAHAAPGIMGWTSPAQLAALLNRIFGSWHGRFSVASSLISGATSTRSVSGEAKISRKWQRDEVSLAGRYDFAQTTDRTSSDVLKASGNWRHQLTKRTFATYRPTLEWNRAAVKSGRPVDYLLLQQEIGAGVALYNRANFKLRVGLAESLFDNWLLTDDDHTSRNKESVFSELELKLPWQTTLTDRGALYYSLGGEGGGWENQLELSKKFSNTLSLSLRHEIRRQETALKVEDYALWRLLVGFDF